MTRAAVNVRPRCTACEALCITAETLADLRSQPNCAVLARYENQPAERSALNAGNRDMGLALRWPVRAPEALGEPEASAQNG